MRISDTGTVRTVRYATEDGVQVGNVEIVPRWTLEHPEWEDQDGIDLFWEIVDECDVKLGRDANGDGEIAIVRWKKY